MIVVADSGPTHYLILLDHVGLLQRFYGAVAMPDAVAAELRAPGASEAVRTWAGIRHRGSGCCRSRQKPSPPSLTISTRANDLAEMLHADLLLIDEAAGRAEAKRRQLRVTGTLGVLRAGAELGRVNVPDVMTRLRATSFYVDEALLQTAFALWLKP